MKILHVLDHSIPLHSGYAFRTRAILEHQRGMGMETWHVTGLKQGDCSLDEEEVDGLNFYRTRAGSGWLQALPGLDQLAVIQTLSRRIDELVQCIRPDIIHAHSPALNGLAALRIARRHGLPLVYEVRAFWEDAAVDHGTSREGGLRYQATRALETLVLRRADAITTICEGLRGDIVARGIPANKVTVIPNAVDPERFGVTDAQAAAGRRLRDSLDLGEAPVLGFIGSFYAYEGLPLLVAALPRILEQVPDARLLLVGGGPQEKEVHDLVRQLGVSRHVILTGRVPHGEITAYYQMVDVFVYPRLSMRLTDLVTPLKPLEAMAQEKLVVASDVGGHRELIQDGKNGVLFRAGDTAALAAAVIGLLQSPSRWEGLRQQGRTFIENERSWARSVGRYVQVYKDACSHHD